MKIVTTWKGRLTLPFLVYALASAAPAGAAPPGECATIKPTSEVTAGMVGEGWTVSQGTTPEPFDATVLGVLENGVGAGRDMIIVETSSPAIDEVGGIWFGMSGSPVYVGGELIGVVAFGLSFGPSPIAGLTPASEIETVHDYPLAAALGAPKTVRLPQSLARTVARRVGTSRETASTMTRLKMPVSVSGVDARGMKRVNELAKRRGAEVVAYNGASVRSIAPGDPAEIVPGGNFAAALSYGDVTFAGVGTTSYVCDGRAIAFGHPFLSFGQTSLGANVADALTIVGDPVFGPFKLATIGGNVGILDQDRTAGIRGLLGTTPESVPVISALRSRDTGRGRIGETEVLLDRVLPDLAFLHVLSNLDSVQDAIGEGSAQVGWEIHGTDGDGEPWSLSRRDIFASEFDVSIELAFELADEVWELNAFRRDGVSIDSVGFGGFVKQAYEDLRIVRVLRKQRGRYWKVGDEITAAPGQLVKLRVNLRSTPRGSNRRADFRLRMPDRFRGGVVIELGSGPVEPACEDELCGDESFEQVLDRLASERGHNVLGARVLSGARLAERSSAEQTFGRHVLGFRSIFVGRG